MVFLPADRFLWDFWFATGPGADPPYHLFYLQAPRDLPDPELRHGRATIGHAVSRDLRAWHERPTAMTAGPPGSWDDKAIWTGSILHHDNRFWFFYTAINHWDRAQRIGLATSTDLQTWERHPHNPLLSADPRWYDTEDPARANDEPCRDPWVIPHPSRDGWLMVYTARAKLDGPLLLDGAGVIGTARSTDLLTWEPGPPLTTPGDFGEMEVPQILQIGNRWYCFFCTRHHSTARLARTGPDGAWSGTHYLIADSLDGPFQLPDGPPLVVDHRRRFYAGRITTGPGGNLVFLAWRERDDRDNFVGGLSDPAPVTVLPDGTLRVDIAQLWP